MLRSYIFGSLLFIEIGWIMFAFMFIAMTASLVMPNVIAVSQMMPVAEIVILVLEESCQMKFDDEAEAKESKYEQEVLNEDKETGPEEQENEIGPSPVQFVPTGKTISTRKRKMKKTRKPKRENCISISNIKEYARMKVALFIGIAYSSSIGGTGTLIGNPLNAHLRNYLTKEYPESKEITFNTWMLYNLPSAIFMTFSTWLYLTYFLMEYKERYAFDKYAVRKIIEREYEKLGRITFHEFAVSCFSIITMLVWLLNPVFLANLLQFTDKTIHINSGTTLLAISLFLFVIPAKPSQLGQSPNLLDWTIVHRKLPWGTLIIFGGNFALNAGTQNANLMQWFERRLLIVFEDFSPEAIVIIMCILTIALTQIVPNISLFQMITSTADRLAQAFQLNPLYLLLTTTVCCSFGYMFPASSATNILILQKLNMRTKELIIPGMYTSLTSGIVEIFMINTVGKHIFDLSTFPAWANKGTKNVTTI